MIRAYLLAILYKLVFNKVEYFIKMKNDKKLYILLFIILGIREKLVSV
jgi:hypothetical protein